MVRIALPDFDTMDLTPGPYDGTEDTSPWFLPPAPAVELPPLPRADRRALIDPAAWAAAQARLSAELARVALLYGALQERLRAGPPGWQHRLAVLEAAEISWAVGDRIGPERLVLWEALRLSGIQDDAQALSRAAFVLRRLAGGAAPLDDLPAFLSRRGAGADLSDLTALARDLAHLHPVTQAAALAQAWALLGETTPAREVEAATLAARHASTMGRAGAGFLPLTLSLAALPRGALPQDRLASLLRQAERATLAALMHLDRLSDWTGKANLATRDLQGRTPARLIAVLAEWPMVTSPMAEQIIGANQATIQRNLARLQTRDLIREVTGQGRYRVWTARI